MEARQMTVKPRRPMGGVAKPAAISWGPRHSQETCGSPERRAVDYCQRAAPAHPGGPTRSLSRPAGGTHRPEGQPGHDCTASLRALFGVARR